MSIVSVADKISALYPKILRLARKFDKQEPEDLAQAVTLNLLSHPDRLPDQKEIPTAWVQQVVRNASLDAFRQRKRLVQFDAAQQAEGAPIGNDVSSQLQLTTASPESEIDMRLDLVAAMSDLSEAQRDTMLRRANGCSFEEIACAEHTKVGTIRSRVHYASKSIFGKLQGSAAEDFACKDIPPEQLRSFMGDPHWILLRLRQGYYNGAILRFGIVLGILTICSLIMLRLHH